jgi:hypothetical protein
MLLAALAKGLLGLGNVHLCTERSGHMHDAVSSCFQGMPAFAAARLASEARKLMIPSISAHATNVYYAELFAQQVRLPQDASIACLQQRPKPSAPSWQSFS